VPRHARVLTKRDLDALRRAAEADPGYGKTLADAGQPGLYVQARRGKVRFFTRYRSPGGGGRRTMDIDFYGAITLEQARKIAQERRGEVAAGRDPQVERAEELRQGVTVEQAVAGYLADFRQRADTGAARGKRSGFASAKNRLERHVVPALGRLRLRDVAQEHVRRLHRDLTRAPVEANRTLTAFSAVFGWADRTGIVPAGTNPVRHVERYVEAGTRRALTAEELDRLGEVLRQASDSGTVIVGGKARTVHPSLVLAVRLLALTGMRASEVLGHGAKDRRNGREGLRWGDIDLDAGLVHLADSKTGRQTRVLGQAAVDLLRAAKPKKAGPNDPVCPGDRPGAPLVGTGRPRRYLWLAAGIGETAAGRADLHSLRHSFATVGAHLASGRYLGAVAPLLGHGYQRRSITERYITENPEALRPAADAISAEIARSLRLGGPARVVAFPTAGGR
jgi:integrase